MKSKSGPARFHSEARSATQPVTPDWPARRRATCLRACSAYRSACSLGGCLSSTAVGCRSRRRRSSSISALPPRGASDRSSPVGLPRPPDYRRPLCGSPTGMRIGYFLSSEEWGPGEIVGLAVKAKVAGFDHLWISDHYHPWNDEQGHSPFVWSAIGAIARAAEGVTVTTAVTCPMVRIHPAIIAQAAATSALLLDGRFRLGVGSGEALNEHILGDRWPEADERLEMHEEAVTVIRRL